MSGGSLNYAYLRVQAAADEISEQANGHPHQNRLKAFAGAVQLWAEMLRSVEYDFSQDQEMSESDLAALDIYTKAAKAIRIPHAATASAVAEQAERIQP